MAPAATTTAADDGNGVASYLPVELSSWIEKASSSFDESFKQFQNTYDEVINGSSSGGTNNPYVLTPTRTSTEQSRNRNRSCKSSYESCSRNKTETKIKPTAATAAATTKRTWTCIMGIICRRHTER